MKTSILGHNKGVMSETVRYNEKEQATNLSDTQSHTLLS